MPRENPRIKKPSAAMIQELEMRRIKRNPVFSRGANGPQDYRASLLRRTNQQDQDGGNYESDSEEKEGNKVALR